MIGYPMLMIGKTDKAKAYTPYGISLRLTEIIMPFGLSLPEKFKRSLVK